MVVYLETGIKGEFEEFPEEFSNLGVIEVDGLSVVCARVDDLVKFDLDEDVSGG